MPRFLIIVGVIIIFIGIFYPALQKLGIGQLPGDIVIRHSNFRFYFPITTSIIISCIFTLILWLIKRY